MQVELGDYILFDKRHGFTTAILEDAVKVELEDEVVIVQLSDVIANLGANPKIGSVYGKRVEPLLHEVEHPNYGKIQFYTRLSKLDKMALKKALSLMESKMSDLGISGSVFPIDLLRIKQNKGKYAGYYRQGKEGRIIDFHPKSYSSAIELAQLGFHELGHDYWVNGMTDSQRADWSVLYAKYVDKRVVEKDVLDEVCEAIKDTSDLMSYAATLEAEQLDAFNIVVDEICASNNLTMEDLTLIHSMSRDHIEHLMPDFSSKQLASTTGFPISDYAGKASVEFFAESFRVYCTGKQLPKKIHRLMKLSIGQ